VAHVALGAAVRPPPREVEHLPRQARTGPEILLMPPIRLRIACTLPGTTVSIIDDDLSDRRT